MARPVYYVLADGTRVYVPRLPIERAGIAIPGPLTRPDGTTVEIMEDDENE